MCQYPPRNVSNLSKRNDSNRLCDFKVSKNARFTDTLKTINPMKLLGFDRFDTLRGGSGRLGVHSKAEGRRKRGLPLPIEIETRETSETPETNPIERGLNVSICLDCFG